MTPQDTDNVTLIELNHAPYREYRKHLVRDYAADNVRAGAWSKSEAESRAAMDVDGLLPVGPATRNHFLIRSGMNPRAPRLGSYGSRSGTRASEGQPGSTISSSTKTLGAKATPLARWSSSRPGPESSAPKAWSYTCSATTMWRRLSTRRLTIT